MKSRILLRICDVKAADFDFYLVTIGFPDVYWRRGGAPCIVKLKKLDEIKQHVRNFYFSNSLKVLTSQSRKDRWCLSLSFNMEMQFLAIWADLKKQVKL